MRSMKQRLASALLVLGLALVVSAPASAQTQQSFNITATVSSILEILMIDDQSAANAAPYMYIGTLNLRTNNPAGFRLTVTSANDGFLVHSTDPTSTIRYEFYLVEEAGSVIGVDDSAGPMGVAGSDQPSSTPVEYPFPGLGGSGTSAMYSVNLILDDFINNSQGDYLDTLTFDIADW